MSVALPATPALPPTTSGPPRGSEVRTSVRLSWLRATGSGRTVLVMTGRRLLAVAGATAVAAIVAVVVMAAVGVFDSSDNHPASAQGGAAANTINRIYQREGRSVYFVQSSGPDGAGTGTAWLYDGEGHLVTNEHVI